jgi:hypothetical protein
MPDQTSPEDVEQEDQEQLTPLEAIRRAQANRVPPPGTGDRGGKGGKGRGANPSAPRMYNRHK